MKKRLIFLVVIALAVSFPGMSMRGKDGNGHWTYDSNGGKNGCDSPGTDCTWK